MSLSPSLATSPQRRSCWAPNYDAEEIGSMAVEGTSWRVCSKRNGSQRYADLGIRRSGNLRYLQPGYEFRKRAVSGTLGWSNEYGSMSCPVSGNVALRSGSTAHVTSLVWDTAKCELVGTVSKCAPPKGSCPSRLPWPAVAGSTTISITEFPVKVEVRGGCNVDAWTGSMTATPNNHYAITSTTLSGTLLMDGAVSAGWSGSLSWTPSRAVFGF